MDRLPFKGRHSTTGLIAILLTAVARQFALILTTNYDNPVGYTKICSQQGYFQFMYFKELFPSSCVFTLNS